MFQTVFSQKNKWSWLMIVAIISLLLNGCYLIEDDGDDDDNNDNNNDDVIIPVVLEFDQNFGNNGFVQIEDDPGGKTQLVVEREEVVKGFEKEPESGMPERVLARLKQRTTLAQKNTGRAPIEEIRFEAIAQDAQGRLVAFGTSTNDDLNNDPCDLFMVRLNDDGSFDTSLGGTGFIADDLENEVDDLVTDGVIDQQGKFVVVGFVVFNDNQQNEERDMVVRRFNNDGTRDNTFANNGAFQDDGAVGNANSNDLAQAVVIDSQNRIVVVGSSDGELALWRLDANGDLDTTFGGGDGIVTVDVDANSQDVGNDILIDGSGKIVVVGSSTELDDVNNENAQKLASDLIVLRFNANGTLDNTFDNDGIAILDGVKDGNSREFGNAIDIDAKGRLAVTGEVRNDINDANQNESGDVLVARFNRNGSIDTTFAENGFVTIDNIVDDQNQREEIGTSLITRGNQIVITGQAKNAGFDNRMFIVGFNEAGDFDPDFNNAEFLIDAPIDNQDNESRDIFVDRQNRLVVCGKVTFGDDGAIWRFNLIEQ